MKGIVERTVVPDTPMQVEYALTNKGRALVGAFDALSQWADKWVEAASAPPKPARSSNAKRRTKQHSSSIRRNSGKRSLSTT